MEETIINRVSKSPLKTIDLAEYLDHNENVTLDISEGLYQGLVLKEKDFREWVKAYDWTQLEGKNVAINCSADAIVPSWAYMLVATKLDSVAHLIVYGTMEDLEKSRVDLAISKLLADHNFTDAKVVIKGCGEISNRDYAYFEIAKRLTPVVSSLMYGEPCSTVPVFKKRK